MRLLLLGKGGGGDREIQSFGRKWSMFPSINKLSAVIVSQQNSPTRPIKYNWLVDTYYIVKILSSELNTMSNLVTNDKALYSACFFTGI